MDELVKEIERKRAEIKRKHEESIKIYVELKNLSKRVKKVIDNCQV